jgi:hypothetical protein
MLVEDELTSSSAGWSDTKTVYDIIETALKKLKKYLTSYALSTLCLLEEETEL